MEGLSRGRQAVGQILHAAPPTLTPRVHVARATVLGVLPWPGQHDEERTKPDVVGDAGDGDRLQRMVRLDFG